MGTKQCVVSPAFRSPRGRRLGFLVSTSPTQGQSETCSEAETLFSAFPRRLGYGLFPSLGFEEVVLVSETHESLLGERAHAGSPPGGVGGLSFNKNPFAVAA